MYIIAKDGSGDFTSIQEAIDAIPGGGRAPTILLLRMDEYHERVVVNKDNVRIVGEARDRTVIASSHSDGMERDAFLPFTMLVTGTNVEVENLTIRYDAGDGREASQAVAVCAAGDRGVWRNCHMIAHQTTLFCGPLPKAVNDMVPRQKWAERVESAGDRSPTCGRQYFEDCSIQGGEDVISGSYRCWFERCALVMNALGGWSAAAYPPENRPHGLVFHQCLLTGARGEEQACLGYPGQKRMTAREAACVNIPEVIGGWDNWRPDQRVPTWFLCGDSTMANYPADKAPMTGWGQKLQALLTDDIHVENCAVNGRSSKSFVAEKRLNFIELCLRKGDKLVISFSHNDEKSDPERSTHPRMTFPNYLGMYIDAARRQGAEPILVTPIARRHFDGDGRLIPTHGAYPDAMRNLADERGVRLIDLEKATMRLCRLAGVEGTKDIFCHVPAGHPNYPDGLEDNSHLREDGATRVAELFLSRMNSPDWQEEDFENVAADDCSDLIAREDSVLG